MATLDLLKLECIRKNDLSGKDEPQITVDGDPVWNGVVAKDSDVKIDVQIDFTGSVEVVARELNGTKPKQIGPAAVVRETGNPDFLTFKTSGTWYKVYFQVTRPTTSTSTQR